MLLIPRVEGVETKPIKTSYSQSAGTAFITFENVKVPVENLLGEEGQGMKVVLSNFNHERWGMACMYIPLPSLHMPRANGPKGTVISQCRAVVEECLKWANQRIVFGKRLVDQPVVRQKWVPLDLQPYGATAEKVRFSNNHLQARQDDCPR